MIPLDFALAAALLTTSPVAPEDQQLPPVDAFVTVRPTLQSLALSWEILDPRETRYVLNRAEDLAADLRLLRRRCVDLAEAPPLHDCMRFPDRALVNDMLAFNRAYRQNLDTLMSVERAQWWEVRNVIQEVDRLYQIWDLVRDARCEYYYVSVRRGALKRLREAIGDDAYYSGCLPPHVPVWRFARAN
jgi:hypothetical protein